MWPLASPCNFVPFKLNHIFFTWLAISWLKSLALLPFACLASPLFPFYCSRCCKVESSSLHLCSISDDDKVLSPPFMDWTSLQSLFIYLFSIQGPIMQSCSPLIHRLASPLNLALSPLSKMLPHFHLQIGIFIKLTFLFLVNIPMMLVNLEQT